MKAFLSIFLEYLVSDNKIDLSQSNHEIFTKLKQEEQLFNATKPEEQQSPKSIVSSVEHYKLFIDFCMDRFIISDFQLPKDETQLKKVKKYLRTLYKLFTLRKLYEEISSGEHGSGSMTRQEFSKKIWKSAETISTMFGYNTDGMQSFLNVLVGNKVTGIQTFLNKDLAIMDSLK